MFCLKRGKINNIKKNANGERGFRGESEAKGKGIKKRTKLYTIMYMYPLPKVIVICTNYKHVLIEINK